MGVSKSIIKHSLLWGNLAVLLIGAVLLGFGVYTLVGPTDLSFLSSASQQVSIAALVVGCLVVALSFLGCCGACCESRLLIGLFLVGLLLLMLAEFAIAGVAYVRRNDISDTLGLAWNEATDATKIQVQNSFQCCGWDNITEQVRPCNYTIPCGQQIISEVQNNLLALGIVGIIVAIIQVLAFILGGCFFCCCMRARGLSAAEEEEELLSIKKNPKYEKMESKRQEVADTHAYYRQKYSKI